ncbi:putative secreted effector protein [Blumeria graminis f. sp. tritici 96224]|uniref:Putative secreted effector protein n=2 Tax=Blumeria graminis f. sp. tritici 96224 TaxID=1268274 RepID=A0A656KGZ4_BLUGR|nr:putative secreted effector protein [Blumeria graminis f. sp. tritici 96224]
MHSNRLISCLGIWLISIIAVVQCFTNYNCGNGVEITATEALRVHGQAMSYLADVAANIRPAIKVPYRGTIKNLPTPTYFWHIKSLANHQGGRYSPRNLLQSTNLVNRGGSKLLYVDFINRRILDDNKHWLDEGDWRR